MTTEHTDSTSDRAASTANPSVPRPRVLVADDDPDMLAALVATLRSAGFAVAEAHDGIDVLDRFATAWIDPLPRDPIDVIVSDNHMPGLTGLDVVAGLRNIDWSTPFVLITAVADPATRLSARGLGVRILEKPVDGDALIDAVRSALPSRE